MTRFDLAKGLCAGVSLGALIVAPHVAFAQEAASAPDVSGLEEVVVTATRQSDTVNRVPLSIAAVTQQNLDQQGIKQASDITRLVPGLNVTQNAGASPGVATFSIRGIVGGTGSATTGIYLDDTNLAKRANNGVNQNNGAPTPILFDLERVEVLKGPQGTLYGGSSEGGTVRFITPNPSLTVYSGLLRLEGRKVKLGEEGYEIGAAVGGPIVEDKLGFRASAVRRKTGGYIDAFAPYGATQTAAGGVNPIGFASPGTTLIRKDANALIEEALSGKLLWQVNERGSIMLTAYASKTTTEGGPNTPTDVYSGAQNGAKASSTETFTTPDVCLGGVRQTAVLDYNPTLALGADTRVASAFSPGNVNCATANAANTPGFFLRRGATYGPFPQGRDIAYKTTEQGLFPSSTQFETQSIVLNYDFDHMNVKSITSFVHDLSKNVGAGGEDQTQKQSYIGAPIVNSNLTNPVAAAGVPVYLNGVQIYSSVAGATGGPINPATRTAANPAGVPYGFGALYNANTPLAAAIFQGASLPNTNGGTTGAMGAAGGFPLWAAKPDYPGLFTASSRRNVVEQELRFSSSPSDRPLTWVAGLFYSSSRIHQLYYYADRGLAAGVAGLFGPLPGFLPAGVAAFPGGPVGGSTSAPNPAVSPEFTRYGVDNQPICHCDSYLEANIKDTELAAYGEANYYLTDKLHITLGLRLSRLTFDFVQDNFSSFGNRYPNAFASYVKASSTDSPTTPKVSVTYELTSNDLVYVTAAKGFRAGGANSPVSPTVCAPALLQLFGQNTDPVADANLIPPTFGPDTVWSYEAGGKFRLLDNKLQLNGAVYRIDWKGVQSTFALSCGLSFVTNGAGARSEGADLQIQFRPFQPLTLAFNASYTNARYIDPVTAPAPATGKLFNAGDKLAVAPWQISASANFDFNVMGKGAYVRADYQWQDGYHNIGSVGTSAFSPFTFIVPSRGQMNARAGVRFDQLEVNVFAQNLFDQKDKVGNAGNGKTTCNNTTCTSYVNFTPFVNQGYLRPREIGIQANYRF